MKTIKLLVLFLVIILLTGCVEQSKNELVCDNGCAEYGTEYRLDCGVFISEDSFCLERKYEVCKKCKENTEVKDENN